MSSLNSLKDIYYRPAFTGKESELGHKLSNLTSRSVFFFTSHLKIIVAKYVTEYRIGNH